MKIPNSPRAGFVLGVAGVAILSPDALLLRLFGGDNFALVAGRGFALAILAGICFAALPALRRDFVLRPVLIYGALYAAGLAAFPMSVRHTHVANTVVILAVAPLLSAIGAKLFLREHIAARTWAACALSAAGLALVFAPELAKGGGFGDASGVGCCVFAGGVRDFYPPSSECQFGTRHGVRRFDCRRDLCALCRLESGTARCRHSRRERGGAVVGIYGDYRRLAPFVAAGS